MVNQTGFVYAIHSVLKSLTDLAKVLQIAQQPYGYDKAREEAIEMEVERKYNEEFSEVLALYPDATCLVHGPVALVVQYKPRGGGSS
ncbi:unnamed protein product [Thelazia callipaeda]|uniref:NERD domain-containing protein n=1 Tax=Thelazia callipaeda TaxID=103827 RepID=A0A0N5CT63_THECL|nr:unnamed protein product [Thelazia callipaeda]